MTGTPRPKAVVSWSSGKDCAFALHEVRTRGEFEVVGMLTTVTTTFGRVSMHGVREELLDRQAEAVDLPLVKVEVPFPCPNEVYERAMAATLARLRSEGVEVVVFGDLFLEDVRRYRESRMEGTGLRPEFPLWKRPTKELARSMLDSGLRATIVCVDPKQLPAEFAGRPFDADLLRDLPPNVDPCGERGEFHTFVTSGPMFSRPVRVKPGPVVERDGFVFADLLPDEGGSRSPSPTLPYRVRPATPEDLVGMARVHVATWRSTYRGIVPDERLDGLTVESDIAGGFGLWLKKPPEGVAQFVATTAAGEVVGFAMGCPAREPDPDFSGELGSIYVRKEHQGCGVGRALVGEVVRHLLRTGKTNMVVWVLEENPYRRFYERLGGTYLRRRVVASRIAMGPLPEVSYGWKDLRALAKL